jgi:hypothetical protein
LSQGLRITALLGLKELVGLIKALLDFLAVLEEIRILPVLQLPQKAVRGAMEAKEVLPELVELVGPLRWMLRILGFRAVTELRTLLYTVG